MNSPIQDEINNLKIGISDKKKEIYIPYQNRFLNTLVLGNKGTGKTSLIFREFAYQTILEKNVGGTFIVSSKNLGYELYLLAKLKKRRFLFISPSVSCDAEDLINENHISKEKVSAKFDFDKLIFNNYIVIVDMEPLVYGDKSVEITSLIIECLRDSMYKSEYTCMRPHFLYVDDAFRYLDSVEDILYYGNQYNIATTLFLQNRNQLQTPSKDYTSFIDSNVGNTILTNSLVVNDSKHYSELLDINLLACNKSRGKIFYELKNKDGAKFTGSGEVKESMEINELLRGIYEEKKSLLRKKAKERRKREKELQSMSETPVISHEVEDKSSLAEHQFTTPIEEKEDTTTENVVTNVVLSDESNSESDNDKFDLDSSDFDDGKIELVVDWDDYDF